MRALAVAMVTLTFVLYAQPTWAGEGGGFAELRLSLFPGAAGKKWQTIERVRPTFEIEISDRLALVSTIEAGMHQGRDNATVLRRLLNKSDIGPLLKMANCTWPEHKNSTLGIDGSSDYLDVDRFYLDIYSGPADLRIGRQAIHWGSAQFLNPTDPFPEVLFAEPWRPRRGVNAARAIVPFGRLNDVTAVVATNDVATEIRAAARVRLNWMETDWSVVGAWRSDGNTGLVGLDLRGTLGVGWWVEAAVNLGDGDPHEAVTIGVDYSFPVLESLVIFAQVHRNGAGATDPDSYGPGKGLAALEGPDCAVDSTLFTGGAAAEPDPFATFLSARDYLMLGTTIAFDEYLSGSIFALQNLNDGTALVAPTVTYVALEWLEVALTAQIPLAVWGNGGEFKPRASDLQLSDPTGTFTADLSGLAPDATVVVWTRASF